MPVSSKSFFHFTSGGFDVFTSILQNGFRISVSHEAFELERDYIVVGIPMVCFCDIPISNCEIHASHFCKDKTFVLGLNRERLRERLEPVRYSSKNIYEYFQDESSNLLNCVLRNEVSSGSFPTILERLKVTIEKSSYKIPIANKDNTSFSTSYWSPHLALTKPERGHYWKYKPDNGTFMIDKEDYIFYNEREWRHVLSPETGWVLPYYKKEQCLGTFNNYEIYNEQFHTLKTYCDLHENFMKFNIDDITWLIVDSEATVLLLINIIRDEKFRKIGGTEIQSETEKFRLIQKIVSFDNIKGDVFSH